MIRFAENLRGAEIFASGRVDAEIEAGKRFSVIIFNGKGEIEFKKIDGVWHERVHSVDRCFGHMKSVWKKFRV